VFGRLFPPTARANDIELAIAVDVAHTQAVREAKRAGHGMLVVGTRLTDGVHLPRRRRIFAGREIGHLPLVAVAIFAAWLKPHDEHAFAGAEQIDVLGCFITGAVPKQVLFPVSFFAFGVFVPVHRLAGERNDEQIGVAVAVDVVGPAAEALAIDLGV